MASTESVFTNATPAEDVVVSGVSDGPTVVAVPEQNPGHDSPAGPPIVRGEATRGAGYFEEILSASKVHRDTKAGVVVHDSALTVLEALACQESESVWVFDDAKEIGFGGKVLAWSGGEEEEGAIVFQSPKVNLVQTRIGAGTALAGFLSSKAHSSTASKPTTVFATSTTLPLLLPILSNLPADSHKIIIHVATTSISSDSEDLSFRDDFKNVLPHLSSIPEAKFDIVLSSTRNGIVATGASAYASENGRSVVHIFESTYAGRETAKISFPSTTTASPTDEFAYSESRETNDFILVPSSHLANYLASTSSISSKVTIIALNTWSTEHSAALLTAVSSSTKAGKKTAYLVTESQAASRAWREVITGALYSPAAGSSKNVKVLPTLKSLVIPSLAEAASYLATEIKSLAEDQSSTSTDIIENAKVVSFYTNAESPVPRLLNDLFLNSPSLDARLAQFGSSTAQGVKSILALSPSSTAPKAPAQPISIHTKSDVVWITEPQIMKQNDIVSSIKDGGLLVMLFPWEEEEVENKLSCAERLAIKQKKIRVFLMPPTSNPVSEECAFLMLYAGKKKLPDAVKKVLDLYYSGNLGREAVEEAQAGLTEVAGIEKWNTELEPEEKDKEEKSKPEWEWDALAGKEGLVDAGAEGMPELGNWSIAAKHLLFREAFEYDADPEAEKDVVQAITALRPSLEDKTYLVTVTENRRLTPETYDRNVFHIAFDTEGTGLEYAVGEALGIHGWNDAAETQEFIDWYGLDADELVSYPSPHDGGKTFETRTVYQLMHQNLDLFGKPSKSFYASLALLAKDRDDQRTLRFIAAPEGVALFKRLSEKETVTFADVLKQFKSARPSFEELIGLIPEIKPRHYSIASSQKFVGNKVELLIVTVDWLNSKGSPRFGQCTRYLAGLDVGAKVTVSLKPSVMKLPPLDSQPIIMAGLGTGAAPFRAFIQHRAWQKSQGMDVGPLVYYFGSRYRSQEYLYGEEIEAYMASGVIAHAGLAFSRDGKDKSYIQHKMTQDKALLSKMLTAEGKDAAYFYLCGPTWPVPDVYEALVSSLQEEGGKERKEAEDYIEELKEAERYVLEVY